MPTIGEMHVQAKKQRSAFMLQLDTDRQGLASTTPPLESRITLKVCAGVGWVFQTISSWIWKWDFPSSLVLQRVSKPLSKKHCNTSSYWFTNLFLDHQRTVDLGKGVVTHSFLAMPEFLYPLLGCDLLHKLRRKIHF